MTLVAEAITTYGGRRERARELGARLDFAQEPLRLYLALVDAQERVFERARMARPSADELAAFVVRDALPHVMEAAVAAGPERLREADKKRRPRRASAQVVGVLSTDTLGPEADPHEGINALIGPHHPAGVGKGQKLAGVIAHRYNAGP